MNLLESSCLFLALPFFGAVFSYLKACNGYKSGVLFCVSVSVLSFLASCYVFYNFIDTQAIETVYFFTWIKSETIRVDWGFRFDSLSTLMVLIITTISSIVHVYSIEYMRDDPNKLIFFGHLSLFTFVMILMVTAPNMLQLFCGWEAISLVSYLLIGYWGSKHTAVAAAVKAFSVNRISDVGLIFALGLIFSFSHTLDFDSFFMFLRESKVLPSVFWLNVTCLFLFFGAMGKSAQFGLHIWLPDAMEAPTPVSAFLHAATMVTAGIFLIVRFSALFEMAFYTKQIIMFIGALTGLSMGMISFVQDDIKKAIAYSTSSQLGLMFMACGAGAYAAAFFYLLMHAFFKALIFLCAGSVIHAMSKEQNMLRMGGLKTYLRSVHHSMLIGMLALVGFPFTSGFYSKESVVSAIYTSKMPYAFLYFIVVLLLTFITGLYAWRIFFMVFYGRVQANEQVIAHVHKTKKVMEYPVILLAFFTLFLGYIGFNLLIDQSFGSFWDVNVVVHLSENISFWMKLCIFIPSLLAFAISYLIHVKNPSVYFVLLEKFPKVYQILKEKLYVDEFYHQIIVAPFFKLGGLLYRFGDREIIDRFGPEGISKLVFRFGEYLRQSQTGCLSHYAFIGVWGVVLMITICLLIWVLQMNAFQAVGNL